MNLATETSDVNWMNIILLAIIKVSKCKLGSFEYAQSITKWPERLVYIGNIINYLFYFPVPFARGLEIDLEKSGIFPIFILSMDIDK